MKEKSKNKLPGKILSSFKNSNVNSSSNIISANITQNYTKQNSETPSAAFPSKGVSIHKRAHSSFKSKNHKKKNINISNSNKINLNTIIASISNYNSLNDYDKFSKTNLINNKNNSNNNTIKSNLYHTTDSNRTNSFKENSLLSPKLSKWKKLLPQKTCNKKTLVLDLDETLVHSGFIPFNSPSDLVIKIEQENDVHDIHVLVRPHVEEFLEKMSKRFELVIFTASISNYANPLLNAIDKMGYVPFRLFREHCTLINTAFVKDLTRLGRDLKDIIILDNNPLAYSLHQYNGFPIKSWFDDKNDDELLKIIPILEFLSYVPDVRDYIKKIVVQNKIQFDSVKQVISNYNNELKKKMISFDCSDTLKSFNGEGYLHKSKSTKINLLKKKNYNNYRGNKNKNEYINKKRNNNPDFTQLTSLINGQNILNTNTNANFCNKMKSENSSYQNINLMSHTHSLSKGKAKRSLRKNETNINKLIKKKKMISLNTMRYNISSKKIPFNKTNKDSTLNLVNLSQSNYKSATINSNHNCNSNCNKKKMNNNQIFFRPYKNLLYINNIKANNIKKVLTNSSYVNNKMLYNQTMSKENINIVNYTSLKLNKSLKIKKKEKTKNESFNYVQFNKHNLGSKNGKDKKNYYYKINGKYNVENNKEKTLTNIRGEEKILRTIFKVNNINSKN